MNSRSQTGSFNYTGTDINTELWTYLHCVLGQNRVEGLQESIFGLKYKETD